MESGQQRLGSKLLLREERVGEQPPKEPVRAWTESWRDSSRFSLCLETQSVRRDAEDYTGAGLGLFMPWPRQEQGDQVEGVI